MAMKNSGQRSQLREEEGREFVEHITPLLPRIERYVLALAGDRDQGLDLMGETLLRAWEHFHTIRDQQALLSWCFTTARRIYVEEQRKGKVFIPEGKGYAATLLSHHPSPELAPDIQALYSALAQLPVKQREAIVLFELNGFSLREIQEMQGGSITALKVRLHRGRKHLAALLGSDRGREIADRYEERSRDESFSSSTNTTILSQS